MKLNYKPLYGNFLKDFGCQDIKGMDSHILGLSDWFFTHLTVNPLSRQAIIQLVQI